MTTASTLTTGAHPAAAANHIEAASLPPHFRASVCADGTTTTYLRAGNGDLVLLLGASLVEPELDPLVSLLAKSHRVVVPELAWTGMNDAESPVVLSSRLRSFLDGLGVAEVSIVARDDVALPALLFALSGADRVRRLVLTFRDAPDPADTGEPLAERLEAAQCELLLVRDADRDAVARFLAPNRR
ncbi:MAG TPA: hypothetical protein VFZ21_03035 [Gemmatimonadaceae bacterium]|jgi:hypothetical protein|nr:hypothetical protein [Gemmatimonadaceae bacterium]